MTESSSSLATYAASSYPVTVAQPGYSAPMVYSYAQQPYNRLINIYRGRRHRSGRSHRSQYYYPAYDRDCCECGGPGYSCCCGPDDGGCCGCFGRFVAGCYLLTYSANELRALGATPGSCIISVVVGANVATREERQLLCTHGKL